MWIGGWPGGSQYFPGDISDVLLYDRALSPSEIQQLADPSNVMLSGLIVPAQRKVWSVAAAPPSGFIPAYAANATRIAI